MQTEVTSLGQLNVEIDNVIASDNELDMLRTKLTSQYSKLTNMKVAFERESKQGKHYNIQFAVPGPMLFRDNDLIDLLHSIGLVRWRIEAQCGPKA